MATVVQSMAIRTLRFLASLIDENNPPFQVTLVDNKDGYVTTGYLTADKDGNPCFLHGATMEEAQIHECSIHALDMLPFVKDQQIASLVLTADVQYFVFGCERHQDHKEFEDIKREERVLRVFKQLAMYFKVNRHPKVLFTTMDEPDVAYEALLEIKRGKLYIAPDDFGNTLSLPLEEGNVTLIEFDPSDDRLCTINLVVYPADEEHEGAVFYGG